MNGSAGDFLSVVSHSKHRNSFARRGFASNESFTKLLLAQKNKNLVYLFFTRETEILTILKRYLMTINSFIKKLNWISGYQTRHSSVVHGSGRNFSVVDKSVDWNAFENYLFTLEENPKKNLSQIQNKLVIEYFFANATHFGCTGNVGPRWVEIIRVSLVAKLKNHKIIDTF